MIIVDNTFDSMRGQSSSSKQRTYLSRLLELFVPVITVLNKEEQCRSKDKIACGLCTCFSYRALPFRD